MKMIGKLPSEGSVKMEQCTKLLMNHFG